MIIAKFIFNAIDFFYPPFRRLMPLQTFKYAACGGGNMLLDILIYYVSFNFILDKQVLDLGFIAFEPYTAALWMAFCVTFPVGFLLSKYIVFGHSTLRGRIQLFRYMIVVSMNLLLNWVILKVTIEYFNIWPTVARIIAVVIVVTFSYLSQRHFTFSEKVGRKKGDKILEGESN